MSDELRELRLAYSVEGMVRLIELLDRMDIGKFPPEITYFLVHASNAANWHPVEAPA